MLPDYYHEDPFPFNISSEDLSDFYISGEFITVEDAKEKFVTNNIDEMKDIYDKMVDEYLSANFSDYYIAVIHDAHSIVHAEEESITDILKEFNVDLSHLTGNTALDLQLVAVPFDNLEEAENFSEELRDFARIEYWGFGEKVGANQEWIIN